MGWYATDAEDQWTQDRRDFLAWMLSQEKPGHYAAALMGLQQEPEYVRDLRRHGPAAAALKPTGPIFSLSHVERHAIKKALEETGNNRKYAAKLLGLSRSTPYRKLAQYNIGYRRQLLRAGAAGGHRHAKPHHFAAYGWRQFN